MASELLADEKLCQYLVPNIPPAVYYIPNFITVEEEKYLLHQVNTAPKPKWTQLLNRRLQNWGGLPHPKGMVPEKLPQWLETYGKKIADLGAFGGLVPNHVLVNEYLAGQGIMPHLDGPLYYPTVSTITLGSHALLNFYQPLSPQSHGDSTEDKATDSDKEQIQEYTSFDERHVTSILLEPRSLILVREEMYTKYLHGIDEKICDVITDKVANLERCQTQAGETLTRDTRVSLTIRHVPKVLKSKIFLGLGRR